MPDPALDSWPPVVARMPGRPVAAIAADGSHAIITDGSVVRMIGGRALMDAGAVVAAAILDQAIWLVTRGEAEHTLHRFDRSGTPAGPATALGALGDDVAIAATRTGVRIALIEGDHGALVRDRGGVLAIESLGARTRDRRLLLGARGVVGEPRPGARRRARAARVQSPDARRGAGGAGRARARPGRGHRRARWRAPAAARRRAARRPAVRRARPARRRSG